ncbi:hypothetical protein BDV06DRAFT_181499 [Aspergillus oleicola]
MQLQGLLNYRRESKLHRPQRRNHHHRGSRRTSLWPLGRPTPSDGSFKWYGSHKDASLTGTLSTTCTSLSNCTTSEFSISTDWVKVFLARNSTLDTRSLTCEDFDALFRQSIDQYASIIGTHNPDLENMKKAGC